MSNDIVFVEQGQDDYPVLLDHLVDDGGQHGADVRQHGEAQRDPDYGINHAETPPPASFWGDVAIPNTECKFKIYFSCWMTRISFDL